MAEDTFDQHGGQLDVASGALYAPVCAPNIGPVHKL